jgi:hypothetical protein
MARRNRKKHRQDGISLPIPFGGIVVLLSSLAIGYVWLDCRCGAIDIEIKELESQRDAFTKTYLNEQCRWARMKSPRSIEAALREHRIKMALPRNDQIVVLRDPQAPSSEGREALVFDGIESVVMNE